jgi:YD repeat-containing protein
VLGLRTNVDYTGRAFSNPSPAITQSFGHNDRQELTSSTRSDSAALTRAYEYDPIGNRVWSETGSPAARMRYATNELNQHHWTCIKAPPMTAQGFRYDADGNLAEMFVAGDMDCDGSVTFSDISCYRAAARNGCPPNPTGYRCSSCPCLNGDLDGNGVVDLSPRLIPVSISQYSCFGVQPAGGAERA